MPATINAMPAVFLTVKPSLKNSLLSIGTRTKPSASMSGMLI